MFSRPKEWECAEQRRRWTSLIQITSRSQWPPFSSADIPTSSTPFFLLPIPTFTSLFSSSIMIFFLCKFYLFHSFSYCKINQPSFSYSVLQNSSMRNLALVISSLLNPIPICEYSTRLPFGHRSVILSFICLFWFRRVKGRSLTSICVVGRVSKTYWRMVRKGWRKSPFMFASIPVAQSLNSMVCFCSLLVCFNTPYESSAQMLFDSRVRIILFDGIRHFSKHRTCSRAAPWNSSLSQRDSD